MPNCSCDFAVFRDDGAEQLSVQWCALLHQIVDEHCEAQGLVLVHQTQQVAERFCRDLVVFTSSDHMASCESCLPTCMLAY